MGGSGSGGWNFKGRPTVERCISLSISALKKCGGLTKGASGMLTWRQQSFGFETQWHDMIVLQWQSVNDGQLHNQHLGFQWLAHKRNFGGHQYYLVCPCCERQCTVVYFRRRFLCRTCHKLSYRSQRLGPLERLDMKIEKLESYVDLRRGSKRHETIARLEQVSNELENRKLARLVAATLSRFKYLC